MRNEYWYGIQAETGMYYMGTFQCERDMEETEITETVQAWCKENKCRLILIAQIIKFMENLIYPYGLTQEGIACLNLIMKAIDGIEKGEITI